MKAYLKPAVMPKTEAMPIGKLVTDLETLVKINFGRIKHFLNQDLITMTSFFVHDRQQHINIAKNENISLTHRLFL